MSIKLYNAHDVTHICDRNSTRKFTANSRAKIFRPGVSRNASFTSNDINADFRAATGTAALYPTILVNVQLAK